MIWLTRIRPTLMLIFRQLSRNRRRTALTFTGLVLSFWLFTSLQSVLSTLRDLLSNAASETILFVAPANQVVLLRPELPRNYASVVREQRGVVAASPVRFFVGEGRKESQPVVVLGVELGAFFGIHRPASLSDAEYAELLDERNGVVAGRFLIDQNDWEIGDQITIPQVGGGPSVTVKLVGDIDSDDRLGPVMLVNLDYMEEATGDSGRVSAIQMRIERAEFAPLLSRNLDSQFSNYSVPTETTTEKAHMGTVLTSLSEAFGALEAIGYLTLAVTVLVVGNSVSMSIRERTVEIGTLRALGFSSAWISGLVLGEAVLVSIAGGLIGALGATALLASGAIGAFSGPDQPVLVVPARMSVILWAVLLSVPVGGLAAAQPVWSALRVPIVAALRHAD